MCHPPPLSPFSPLLSLPPRSCFTHPLAEATDEVPWCRSDLLRPAVVDAEEPDVLLEPVTLDVLSGDMTEWALLDAEERYCCEAARRWGLPSSKLQRQYNASNMYNYCQTSYISRTLVGNKLVDHLDVKKKKKNWCSWSIACRHCSNYIRYIQ